MFNECKAGLKMTRMNRFTIYFLYVVIKQICNTLIDVISLIKWDFRYTVSKQYKLLFLTSA